MVVAGQKDYGVLCESLTYESVGNKINFEKMEPVSVKGKSMPIEIFKPIPESSKIDVIQKKEETVFLGRTVEKKIIDEMIKDVLSNKTKYVVFEGNIKFFFPFFSKICFVFIVQVLQELEKQVKKKFDKIKKKIKKLQLI